MNRVTDLAVDALAAWRVTHFVTADKLTEPAREAVMAKFGTESGLGYLVTCPWCVGMYAGLAIGLARHLLPRQWRPVGDGLALAGAAALIEVFGVKD